MEKMHFRGNLFDYIGSCMPKKKFLLCKSVAKNFLPRNVKPNVFIPSSLIHYMHHRLIFYRKSITNLIVLATSLRVTPFLEYPENIVVLSIY